MYTHVDISTCTHKRQLHASSNRLPFFFYPSPSLFSSGITASSFLVLSSSWRWIILLRSLLLRSRKQKPDGRRIHRAGRLSRSFSSSNLATLLRSEQFVRGDRWRQDQLQTRRARASLTRESGRDGPKSQVGRMDHVDARFLHLEKFDLSCAEHGSGKDAAKRNERKRRAYTISSKHTRRPHILSAKSLRPHIKFKNISIKHYVKV